MVWNCPSYLHVSEWDIAVSLAPNMTWLLLWFFLLFHMKGPLLSYIKITNVPCSHPASFVFSKVCPVLCVLTMVLCSLLMDNSGLSTWVTWPVGGTPCSRRYQCEVFFGVHLWGMLSLCQGSFFFAPSLSRSGADDHVRDLSMTLTSFSMWQFSPTPDKEVL